VAAEHQHIHTVVDRIQLDGKVISDSHDYRRRELLTFALARDLGLRPIKKFCASGALRLDNWRVLRTASDRQADDPAWRLRAPPC
jgi:hypothetical protein